MGIFDRFKSQAQDKGKAVSDDAEKRVNDKTGGKYEKQVDQAQQQAEKRFGMGGDKPDQH
ncbi:Rv0909 family putative TA system antitoxin [Streptomyces sp. NPDC090306]|uniref:Rv0909 family putative TA system antitoxin n=1 Tax=unclassified Streptomyces TaxID=2593676 RepID=UPI0036F13C15